jgi:hypothetical protein
MRIRNPEFLGAAGGAARLLYPAGALQRRPQPPPPNQREGAARRPAQGAGADPPPGRVGKNPGFCPVVFFGFLGFLGGFLFLFINLPRRESF